jgi:hypothetical protein
MLDDACIAHQHPEESNRAYKRRKYWTMHPLLSNEKKPTEPSIIQMWPNTEWRAVWSNINEMLIPERIKATWFKVIHDIIPTKTRLLRIKLSQTPVMNAAVKTRYTTD